ncbi:hypothetical protein FCJ61_11625 [Burkholderia metallica]|nr:hypothetical protein [Burkholderia metallica]
MARRCLDAHIRGFTEFEGFCTGRFRPGTQSFKSAMFTNFITPAKGRTRFYHCLAHAFPDSRAMHRDAARLAAPSSAEFIWRNRRRCDSRRRFPPAPQHPPIQSKPRARRGPNRLMFVSCFLRNTHRARHREVTNVFDNSPAENVYIA